MTTHDPISVLIRLLENNYIKLTPAREVYEVISSKMTTLDNPEELIAFLGQHLKPKELEKKQNGEVFTPPSLIQEKFDQLTLADPGIWSDPTKKFLDPANGIGNYPALAYQRLMEGLKEVIPDTAERKKHILENMLYMCELNPKNVEVSRKLFDPEGVYALNLYQGSFLDLNPEEEWKVETFDMVFGNPPYQDSTGNKGGGHMLWVPFVTKSLSLIKDNGFLVFVHPAGWRQPGNDILRKFKQLQLHYLSIHAEAEGISKFRSNTRYDWYVLQNRMNYKSTTIEGQDKIILEVDITTLDFIPNSHFHKIIELTNSPIKCVIIHSESAYECRKSWISKTQTDTFTYPVVYSVNRQHTATMRWSSRTDRGHFGIPKVIFGSGATGFIIDTTGEYGMTQWAKAITDDIENLVTIRNVLNSVEFKEMSEACSVGKAEINIKILKYFNKDFWKHFKNPTPLVGKPTKRNNVPSSSIIRIEYDHMTIAHPKQLCKEQKIAGVSEKKKDDLIAMLLAPLKEEVAPSPPVAPKRIKRPVLAKQA